MTGQTLMFWYADRCYKQQLCQQGRLQVLASFMNATAIVQTQISEDFCQLLHTNTADSRTFCGQLLYLRKHYAMHVQGLLRSSVSYVYVTVKWSLVLTAGHALLSHCQTSSTDAILWQNAGISNFKRGGTSNNHRDLKSELTCCRHKSRGMVRRFSSNGHIWLSFPMGPIQLSGVVFGVLQVWRHIRLSCTVTSKDYWSKPNLSATPHK